METFSRYPQDSRSYSSLTRRENVRRLAVLLAGCGIFSSLIPGPRPASAAVTSRLSFATGCCVGSGSIYVVDAGGTNAREVVRTREDVVIDPSWSPDGARIAYAKLDYVGAYATGTTQVRSVGADGAGDRLIASFPPSLWALETAWSPKGDRIAFTVMQAPSYFGAGRVFSKIFVVVADGSGLRPLTAEPALESCARWSPSGAEIAFLSAREGVGAVYVTKVDGVSVPRRVTPLTVYADCPAWSRDGRRIAFTGNHVGGDLLKDPHVWVVNADGSAPRELPAVSYETPSWSPDGSWLAYAWDGIHIVRTDGSVKRTLSDASSLYVTESSPAWSRDGRSIAFIRDVYQGSGTGIWTMAPDGSNQRLVSTGDPWPNAPIAWWP